MTTGAGLKEAMKRHPTGVCVVTVDLEGEKLGLTVGSLVSLSLEPPLVGISIARQAALHELLRSAGGFSASVLAGGQADVAQHFSRGVPPIALWHGVAVRDAPRGPLLEGAVAWLECALEGEHGAGDHTFFVGRVERAESGSTEEPLLRLDGDYRPA